MPSQHFLIFIWNATAVTYGNFFWKLSKKSLGKHSSSGISKQTKLSTTWKAIWYLVTFPHYMHPFIYNPLSSRILMDGLFLANRSSPLFCYGVCVMCMSLTIPSSNVLLIYENALSIGVSLWQVDFLLPDDRMCPVLVQHIRSK